MTGQPAALGYRPGLDGLRGLAVAAVVAYHLGMPGAAGGWLGVSAFFTLSGFLITALLLGEHEATGRIDLRAFWARRARRLLPAAAACLVLAAGVGALEGGPASLPADLRAAVAYVANWRFIAEGTGYAHAFGLPSPVQHLWSLAIEEQFYVVYPLVALVVLRAGGRRALGWTAATAAAASLAAQLVITGTDRRYFGTDARAAELALGALAAVLVWSRRADRRASRAPMAVAGVAALVVLGGLWATASLRWGWWADGGFTAVGIVNAVVVVAAATTPLARPLGVAPLVWLGQRSYGVYLYHWPLLIALSPERTGLDGLALATARVAATLAMAEASYRFLEQPIRQRRRLVASGPALAAAVGGVVVVLAATVALPTSSARTQLASRLSASSPPLAPPGATVRALGAAAPTTALAAPPPASPAAPDAPGAGLAAAPAPPPSASNPAGADAPRTSGPPPSASNPQGADAPTASAPPPLASNPAGADAPQTSGSPPSALNAQGADAPPASASPPSAAAATAAPPPPVVWLVGDSVPYLLGADLAERQGELGAMVVNLALPSCDGARGHPRMRLILGEPFDEPDDCARWETTWADAVALAPPDDVLVVLGATAIVDRDLDGAWRDPCDDDFRAWYEPEVGARLDWLTAHTGARITLATTPFADHDARFIARDRHRRTECINEVYRQAVATRPSVRLVDLAAWLCPDGPDGCRPLRADGLHYRAEHAVEVTRFLLTST